MVEIIHHKPFTKKEIQAVKKSSTVLGNLLSHFPRSEFEKAVFQHDGDKGVRALGSFDLLKTLVYGQVISAFSVREIESSLTAHSGQLYHNGMKPVKRSTLCDALKKRDPAIFEKTFQALVFKARLLTAKSGSRFRNPLKIIDASAIELCLSRLTGPSSALPRGPSNFMSHSTAIISSRRKFKSPRELFTKSTRWSRSAAKPERST